jgi:branched-chain amino acid transport system substrate-binding protein
MISTFATNPKLTEQGLRNVFRVVGRDDFQGRIAGDLLAERWGDKPIAILHDGQAYGKGLAEETKKRLNERGIAEAIFEAIEPGKADYWDTVQKMQGLAVEVLYYGGYQHEAGLLIRQARENGYELQLVAGDGINPEDFGLVAGPASDGTLMSNSPQPVSREASALLARFAPDVVAGADPKPYAAVQVFAQAVEKAGTFETQTVAEALRTHEFDTVLGRIGFDGKGDVTGYETLRLVRVEGWQARAGGTGQADRLKTAGSRALGFTRSLKETEPRTSRTWLHVPRVADLRDPSAPAPLRYAGDAQDWCP